MTVVGSQITDNRKLKTNIRKKVIVMGTNSQTEQQKTLHSNTDASDQDKSANSKVNEYYCPECGTGPVAFQEGCFLCYACGYSKCS